MPYATNDDLPPSVRNHLPPHAQDIFREAFNHAFDRYGGNEALAFRIAWGAVKRGYEKVDRQWVPRGPTGQRTASKCHDQDPAENSQATRPAPA